MIYDVLWLKIVPGQREAALNHLNEMAKSGQEQGLNSRVYLHVTSGPIYQTALITAHESLGAMVRANEALVQTDEFAQWFDKAKNMFSWAEAETQTLDVCRAAHAPDGWQPKYVNVISLTLNVGKIESGRQHMAKLAEHVESKYEVPTDILAHASNNIYRHHWVAGYDTLERYEEVMSSLTAEEKYKQWFADSADMIDFASINLSVGQYLE